MCMAPWPRLTECAASHRVTRVSFVATYLMTGWLCQYKGRGHCLLQPGATQSESGPVKPYQGGGRSPVKLLALRRAGLVAAELALDFWMHDPAWHTPWRLKPKPAPSLGASALCASPMKAALELSVD